MTCAMPRNQIIKNNNLKGRILDIHLKEGSMLLHHKNPHLIFITFYHHCSSKLKIQANLIEELLLMWKN